MHIYNFSAGPAMLPATVLRRAQQELCNWNGSQVSIMEIGHRTTPIVQMIQETEKDLRELLSIPNNYKVLFCQGGARAQFSAIPMNLLGNATTADYIETGFWSRSAAKEAEKYCQPRIINARIDQTNKHDILPMHAWDPNPDAAYLHFCPNETIDGIEIKEDPHFSEQMIVVADCSSVLLSREIDVSRYGVIYAAAQKNMGPPGLTIVIIREDLIGKAQPSLPSILNYQVLTENHSLYNTPPVFSWYLTGLVLKWLKAQGGLREIEKINHEKSQLLYKVIDKSDVYHNLISPVFRSRMNVPFQLINSELETLFLEQAEQQGLLGLKGHRISGGIRASIYNAMPMEGVIALVDFMKNFETQYA